MNIAGTRKVINLIRNVLDTTKSAVSPIEFTERKPIFDYKSENYFERITPEQCGIESERVKKLIVELTENKNVALQSIMLLRNGKVFFEADIGKQNSELPKATFSECKSIVSLAIGVLVTQGKLKIAERITDIFNEKLTPVTKIRLKGLTVKHLLTMTACVTFNESEAMVTKDWVKGFLNSDIEGEFGKEFRYNSLNTYLLSAIITERTGLTLSEFLDSTIFGALGITDYYWEKCPMGIEKGGWGLYIRREDMAKIGLLVMQNGYWNGKKLITPKYINDATKKQIEAPEYCGNYNYGFQIWCARNDDNFLFNGMLGQNLIGYRKNGIIAVVNCGNYDMFQQNKLFEICDRYLNTDFPEGSDGKNEDSELLNELKDCLKKPKTIKSILNITKNERDTTADIDTIDGTVFEIKSTNGVSTGFAPLFLQLIQGNYTTGLKEIGFFKTERGLAAVFTEGDECHRIEIGFDEPIDSIVTFHGEPFYVSSLGEFTQNEDGIPVLKIECDFLETPYSRSYKFFFDSENVNAQFCESPGIELARNLQALTGLLGENGQRLESLLKKFDGDFLSLKFEKAFAPKLVLTQKTENGTEEITEE